jgi:hypothetical protein
VCRVLATVREPPIQPAPQRLPRQSRIQDGRIGDAPRLI